MKAVFIAFLFTFSFQFCLSAAQETKYLADSELPTSVQNSEPDSNVILDLAHKFGVDWHTLIAQMVNFILVAFVLYKFAIKPIASTLDERQKKIADGLQYAEEMKSRLADAEKQHADTLKEAAEQAAKIVNDARETAKTFTENQNQVAVASAEEIIAKAREATELERQQMLADLRKEVSLLVVSTTEKVLSKKLSEADRSGFSEAAAQELYASN